MWQVAYANVDRISQCLHARVWVCINVDTYIFFWMQFWAKPTDDCFHLVPAVLILNSPWNILEPKVPTSLGHLFIGCLGVWDHEVISNTNLPEVLVDLGWTKGPNPASSEITRLVLAFQTKARNATEYVLQSFEYMPKVSNLNLFSLFPLGTARSRPMRTSQWWDGVDMQTSAKKGRHVQGPKNATRPQQPL